MLTKFWLESLKGTDHSKDLGIDERIILKWIFKKVWGCRLESSGSEPGTVMGSCRHGNDPSVSLKLSNFFTG
jgi:hypothetical protein